MRGGGWGSGESWGFCPFQRPDGILDPFKMGSQPYGVKECPFPGHEEGPPSLPRHVGRSQRGLGSGGAKKKSTEVEKKVDTGAGIKAIKSPLSPCHSLLSPLPLPLFLRLQIFRPANLGLVGKRGARNIPPISPLFKLVGFGARVVPGPTHPGIRGTPKINRGMRSQADGTVPEGARVPANNRSTGNGFRVGGTIWAGGRHTAFPGVCSSSRRSNGGWLDRSRERWFGYNRRSFGKDRKKSIDED